MNSNETKTPANLFLVGFFLLPPMLALLLSYLTDGVGSSLVYKNIKLIDAIRIYNGGGVDFLSAVSLLYIILSPLVWLYLAIISHFRNDTRGRALVAVVIAAALMVIFPVVIIFIGPHASAFSGVSLSARFFRLIATSNLIYSLVFGMIVFVGTTGVFMLKVLFVNIVKSRR